MKTHGIRLRERGCRHPGLLRMFALCMAMGTIWACGYLKPIAGPTDSHRAKIKKPGLTPVYHDFDDILIPKAMRINRNMSRLSEIQAMRAGVISLEGQLNRTQLIQFFKKNMAKDNWASADQFIGPRSILQFEKQNRWCVLTITERAGGIGTQLNIWVIPKNDTSESGLLK